MAENKKGFILYADLIHTVKHLTSEEKGILLQHLLEYVNDLNPKLDNRLLMAVFEPIKQQLKRDLLHWNNVRDVRSANGKKGGRPKKLNKPKKANGLFEKLIKPKKAVIDNVTVTVTDNVIVKVNDIKKELNNNLWIEQICMKKKLEIIDVKEYLNIFINDLELKDDLHKPIKELKKHFINWLNIQVKNVKKEIPKTIADKYAHLI